MMVGAVELFSLVWNAARDRRALADMSAGAGAGIAGVSAAGVLIVIGFMFQSLPFDGYEQAGDGTQVYSWGPFDATATNADAQGDGWARYNFLGYEGRDQYYTEYHQVVSTMDRIGDDPSLGCGRALWENNADNGQYGTTMALMLLPFWTDGCIGSMEGLFFEASGTTPYHFLTTAAMSKQSSNPVRELRYVDNNADVGVRHLQDLGVRYVMLRTPEAKAEAAAQTELSFDRLVDAVGHLPGPGLRHRRAARHATRRRAGPVRRPPRTKSRTRHELVPEPERVGCDAG